MRNNKKIPSSCLRLSSVALGILLILFIIGRFQFPVPAPFLVWAATTGLLTAVFVMLTYRSGYVFLGAAIVGIGHEYTREWFYPRPPYPMRFFKTNGVWLSAQWLLVFLVTFSVCLLAFYWSKRQKQ